MDRESPGREGALPSLGFGAGASGQPALRRLLESPPRLHGEEGSRVSFGIQPTFLQYLVDAVNPRSTTLETGAGLSTICFAIAGSSHTCITPSVEEHERIREYCNQVSLSTERIQFVPEPSQTYLARMDLGDRRLDFVLIDGSHAFPNPIIDFYYVNANLRIGGILAVDDLPIPSVGILHRFLSTDPAYEVVSIDAGKTGVYRKLHETRYPHDWTDQEFNRRYPDTSYLSPLQQLRQKAGSSRTIVAAYRALKHAKGDNGR